MKGSLLKFGLFVPLFALFCTVSFGSSSASAQYWSGIQLADSFGYGATNINGELTCEYTDISTTLGTVLADDSKWESTPEVRDQLRQNYSDALNLGHGWALVKDVSPFAGGIRERAYIIINTSSYPVFNTTGIVLPGVSGQNSYILIENKTHLGSCDTRIIGSFTTSAAQYIATPDGIKRPFISTIKINYPLNYDGPTIPTTYTPPTPPSDHTPDWYVSKADKWLVNIHDTNFNTFDDNPFLCNEDGLAPVIDYTISKNSDGTILETGTQSATVQFDWQAPKEEDLIKYDISGKYYCGDESGDMQFTEFGTYHFSVNKHGQLAITAVDDCITELAPYVNLEGCMNNIFGFINLLSFGGITFGGNDWTADTQCRQLGTFSTWLNLSYEQSFLCPQIPADIRNTVTPFITFLLGLLTVTFLSKRHMSDLG